MEQQTVVNKSIEELIEKHELQVFTLAMHLTSSESSAAEVVEEVFIRLAKELHTHVGADIEQVVHQYTYDAAIGRLLSRAQMDDSSDLSFSQLFQGLQEIAS